MRGISLIAILMMALPAFAGGSSYEGIVALPMCSGSLIKFEKAKDTDKALILTNGHCSGQVAPGSFVYHHHLKRPLAFNFFDAGGKSTGWSISNELVYSTMTTTDIAFYELDKTYREIESRHHVRPLTLASRPPAVHEAIEIISGYLHREYHCSLETFVDRLVEAAWTMTDSMRYSRPGCEVIGGTSGSPVISAGTRTVIGLNSTTNENGERCTMNNPCEVAADGRVGYQKGLAYGQETYWIYGCLNGENKIDLSVSGCVLPH